MMPSGIFALAPGSDDAGLPGRARGGVKPRLKSAIEHALHLVKRHKADGDSSSLNEPAPAAGNGPQGLPCVPYRPQELPLRGASWPIAVTDQLQAAGRRGQLEALLSRFEGHRALHRGKLFCVG